MDWGSKIETEEIWNKLNLMNKIATNTKIDDKERTKLVHKAGLETKELLSFITEYKNMSKEN